MINVTLWGGAILVENYAQDSLNYADTDYYFAILIKRIVFLDFIHRLVSQEQIKLKKI
jgi:hypothetical protein